MIYENPTNTPNEENSSNKARENNNNNTMARENKCVLSNINTYTEQHLQKTSKLNENEEYEEDKKHQEKKKDNENDNNSNVSLKRSEVKANLKKIFINIAKYNSKDNSYYITQQTLNKLLKDSRIIAECNISLSEVDLIYQKACSFGYKMNYEQFLNFLIRLAKKLFPEEFYENPKGIVDFFLIDFFDKYNNILNKQKINSEDTSSFASLTLTPLSKSIKSLIQYKPDSRQKVIIFKVYITLRELYNQYIYGDVSYTDRVNTSQQVCMNKMKQFARDFEIIPYIINEKLFVLYFNMIIENNEREMKEEGIQICKVIDASIDNADYFSLDNFCLMIIHFALLSYSKIASYDELNTNEASKLILFLEIMDNTKGMKAFIKTISLFTTNKYSLLLPNQTIIDLNEDIEKEIANSSLQDINTKRNNIATSSLSNCSIKHSNYLRANQEGSISEIIKKHLVNLHRTFLYFCHKGDTLNINRMSFTCYIKFLKNCKLYKNKLQKDKDKEKEQQQHYYYTLDKDKDISNKNKFKSNIKTMSGYILIENNKESTLNETNYVPPLSNIANSSSCDQIGASDATIIFSSLTGPNHSEITSRQSTSYTISNSTAYNMSQTMNGFNTHDKPKSEMKMLQMSFEKFIQSFKLIAHRISANDDTTYYKILTNNIIPNLLKEDKLGRDLYNSAIYSAFEKIKNKEIRYILECFSDAASSIFGFYTNNNRMILFESFLAFYKDFGLYPKLVNLSQLKNMFFIFSEMNNYNHNNNNSDVNDKIPIKGEITYANLLDSLAVTAMLNDFESDYSDIGKMIYVVEQMNQSDGIAKLNNKYKRAK